MKTVTTTLDRLTSEQSDLYYDGHLGYGAWHARCRNQMRRPVPKADSTFALSGVEKIAVLSKVQAATALRFVLGARPARPECRDGEVEPVAIASKHALRALISQIFNPDIDRHLVAYFGSEYRVRWLTATKTYPSPVSRSSFLWHRDWGPRAHAKIILYLNGSDVHGARTDFIDAGSSRRIMEAGYDMPPEAEREADLAVYAAKAGFDFRPISWPVAAGEAILFTPRHVFHRGILPTRGSRVAITLCLVPSDGPWRSDFDRRPLRDLQKREMQFWEHEAPGAAAAASITEPNGEPI